jgi:small-conductance mechanosensitive channel
MAIEDILARYATGAAGLAILVAMAIARALSDDEPFRRDLKGAQRYQSLFLATAFLRALTPRRWYAADKTLYVAGLVLFAFGVIRGAAASWSVVHRRRTGIETPKILRDLVDGVLFLLTVIVILQATLDVNLSPLLASSAVLSLVVGLALQETLGNLFAGLSLQAERPFAEGDWVKIGAHQGKVLEIGWRATRLLGPAGESLTIPNNAVAKEAVYNLTRRGSAMRKVSLSIAYGVPPNAFKAAALSVVCAHPQILRDPAPVVRAADLGQAAIAYDIVFWVGRFEQGGDVEDDVRSQLWYRLQRAGIALAAVGREVRLAREAARPAPDAAPVDVRALLDRVDFLRPVDPSLRAELAGRARVARFGRGEVVIQQGDTQASPFYVIAEGEVTVWVRAPDGHEEEAARLGVGEFFGEMAALTGQPRSATVVAATDCALVTLDRDAFSELFERSPEAARQLADVIARRQEAVAHATEHVAPGTGPQRDEPHQLLEKLKKIFQSLAQGPSSPRA